MFEGRRKEGCKCVVETPQPFKENSKCTSLPIYWKSQYPCDSHPTNVLLSRRYMTFQPILGRPSKFGCIRLLYGFFFYAILTPALALGQPIPKFTLATLVGVFQT